MQSINFSTGIKEYAVNGDENNVIRINVSDLNISKRYQEASEKIEKLAEKYKNVSKPTPEQLAEADKEVRTQLNYVFDSDVCTPAFGNTNCFSPVADGHFLFEAFMEAFLPLIQQDMQATANASKIHIGNKTEKYTEHLEKPPVTVNSHPVAAPVNVYANSNSNLPDISKLTAEEKQKLMMELIK